MQKSAGFAGLDHVEVERVEHGRVLGQRLGQRIPALDVVGEGGDYRWQSASLLGRPAPVSRGCCRASDASGWIATTSTA